MKLWYIILLLMLITFTGYAQDITQSGQEKDLYGLSIEELLNVEVSVASIKPEGIVNTPAVVSRYSVDDLAKLGLRSLNDIIAFVPGFVMDRNISGTHQIMVRGSTSDFGAKVLVLLNGVPYWSPSHSNIPILGIPWAAIDRIEVIRGPGAIIYGSNAIAGVLNIITKETDEAMIQGSYGSNLSINSTGFYRYTLESGHALAIAYEKQHKDDGYDAEVRQSNIIVPPVVYQQQELFESIFIQLQHDNGQLFMSYFNDFTEGATIKTPPLPMPGLPPPMPGILVETKVPDIKTEGMLLHGDFQWNWHQHTFSLFGDYNQYAPVFLTPDTITQFDDRWQDNFRLRAGLLGEGALNEWVDYIIGVETELRSVDTFRNKPKDSSRPELVLFMADDVQEDSIYGQLDFNWKKWRLLVGARATDNDQTGFKITPRTSLVYSLDQQQSIKLLYSVGFTSPNFETNITTTGDSLNPETVEMVDLVYSYITPETLFVANLYYYKGEDFITRFPAPPPFLLFANRPSFTRKGLELDYQVQYERARFYFNLAYNHEGNRESIQDDQQAALVPKLTANFGGHYRFGKHLVGVSSRYISHRQIVNRSTDIAINYQYQQGGLQLFAAVNNVLSDDLFSVNFGPENTVSANQRRDSDINFTIGFKFNF